VNDFISLLSMPAALVNGFVLSAITDVLMLSATVDRYD
jgi:hypothetical protein